MNDVDVADDDGGMGRQGAAESVTSSEGMSAELAEGEELRIPLAREEFTATARPIRSGTVRITKRVVTEDQVLEVPVTAEEIRVERRIVERAGAGGGGAEAYEQIIIEVPLYRDRLDVQKRTRVSDEVIVTKQITRRTEQVRDTVRREEAFVDADDLDSRAVVLGESTDGSAQSA